MNIPAQIQDAIARAESALQADPKHVLRPYYRQQIYNALSLGSKGKEVRIRLDIMAVERVLALSRDEWPESSLPYRLIQQAKDVLKGTARPEVVRTYAHRIWAELEKFGIQTSSEYSERAFYAAQAAVEAAFSAAGVDRWETIEIGTLEVDADLDPWSSDAASWAVAGYAGAEWEEKSNTERRLEFWVWWLSEAIPRAWRETYAN